ncbi:MAG: hypothetical protein KDJ16_17770, partial [Hyphomicrobiales bacterium]|nr:hypothetical protein [Hyphomicrobiales bacterium]
NAVAAQARCGKVFTMPKDTEAQLEGLAGGKLRGAESPLDEDCNAGYNEYYELEDGKGLETACRETYALFGAEGNRRKGLLVAREKPGLKLPEADVAAIATDLCYAQVAAEKCPSLLLTDGIVDRLNDETGTDLLKKGGYFASECGSGTYRAALASGKSTEFCADAALKFGIGGSKRSGLIAGTVDAPAGTAKTASKVPEATAPSTQVQPKAAASEPKLVILTELPSLPDGKTPEDVLGAAPGTLDADGCAVEKKAVDDAMALLTGAANLGEAAKHAVHAAARIKAAAALCPDLALPDLPEDVAQKVVDTGLEACHIVMDAEREVSTAARDYQTKKLYRAMIAISEARAWALKAFLPACSRLTERSVTSRIASTEKQIARDQETYPCYTWQNFVRDETKAVGDLTMKKDWNGALERMDGRTLAAIHGMDAACAKKDAVESTTKYWLSQRKNIQYLMTR